MVLVAICIHKTLLRDTRSILHSYSWYRLAARDVSVGRYAIMLFIRVHFLTLFVCFVRNDLISNNIYRQGGVCFMPACRGSRSKPNHVAYFGRHQIHFVTLFVCFGATGDLYQPNKYIPARILGLPLPAKLRGSRCIHTVAPCHVADHYLLSDHPATHKNTANSGGQHRCPPCMPYREVSVRPNHLVLALHTCLCPLCQTNTLLACGTKVPTACPCYQLGDSRSKATAMLAITDTWSML
jgi:hypothetical protein